MRTVAKREIFFMRLNLVWIRHRHNWCGRTVQTEGVRDDVYEPPERYHHDEGDDAPKNELMALRDFFWFALRENVGLGDAVEEDDEGDREEDWHQYAVNNIENSLCDTDNTAGNARPSPEETPRLRNKAS